VSMDDVTKQILLTRCRVQEEEASMVTCIVKGDDREAEKHRQTAIALNEARLDLEIKMLKDKIASWP